MQISYSLKASLAIFFAIIYLLSPVNEKVFEILHNISHKLSEASSNHHHHGNHINSHSHHEDQKTSRVTSHEHKVLEFINTVLKISDNDEKEPEISGKKKFDKHLIEDLLVQLFFFESATRTEAAYQLKNYHHTSEILSPPPKTFPKIYF